MKNLFNNLVKLTLTTQLLVACSTTHQASSVTKSGFLTNYSQLQAGEEGQALLRYINPTVRWLKYRKAMVDPVRIYAGKKSNLADADKDERQALANYYTAALREALTKDYMLVTKPGPDVMRIRAAITDADSSMVMLNTVTTIMPIGLAVSSLRRAITGSDSFVGEAQSELEIVDSLSGDRLAAAVDRRIGTKALRSKLGAWNDAQAAFDYWAEQLQQRLLEMRKAEISRSSRYQ
jgi:hypothetical protein